VKFTEHGSVTLTMAPASPEVLRGVAGLDAQRPTVAFTVRDTGIGIAPAKLSMIFEAFQQADGTTSRKYGGTGLGLSISRNLARLLGGAITVSSRPGGGSEFTLYLPDTAPQAAGAVFRPALRRTGEPGTADRPVFGGAPEPDGSAGPPSLAGRTVLIVDDDVRNVFALTSALEMHGLRVLYADNGAEGIRLLSAHPEVDIVLMDAMMPDLDGNETTRLIRGLPGGADLPVVFLTAKAMPGDRETSLAAGASDYITKPVDLDGLLATMAAWVAPRVATAAAGTEDGGAGA
jgi:CheY-like chemotaxis protein